MERRIWLSKRLRILLKALAVASALLLGSLTRATNRVVRSTSVPTCDRLPLPTIRSPSQWPGMRRMLTSSGRKSIKILSGMDGGWFFVLPLLGSFCLVPAAHQFQQAGPELPLRHGIEGGINGLARELDGLGHTSQCALDLRRTQAAAQMLLHQIGRASCRERV